MPEPVVAVRDLEDARDLELVRRVQEGDEDAFRTLFRRYGPGCKALAQRVVSQAFLAEEVVQEAFLSLWKRPDAYRPDRGSFRAWLLSTVHHRAVDVVRREESQRRRAQEEQEAPRSPREGDPGQSVVEELDLRERRARVRASLAEIPGEQREVLEMMYFQGMTQSRIADLLELPLGTVKSRTLLGMRRLRSLLPERAD